MAWFARPDCGLRRPSWLVLRKGRDILAQLLDKLQPANELSRFDAEIAAIEADASIEMANAEPQKVQGWMVPKTEQ
jgi:hypothetical protein